jgi:hypothetical protein
LDELSNGQGKLAEASEGQGPRTADDDEVIPCEISSSHGGEYDVQSYLLGYTAV